MANLPHDYRPEIDGLRGVAVLLVIFYHADGYFFPSGYFGVDVFFVISGYIISRIIFREIENETFSLLQFWKRRIRRIIPALLITLSFSTLLALWFLPPKQIIDFSESVLASLLFCSNFLFSQESGYFETVSTLKPLQHTWSLAIEEQFYVIWPIALLIILKTFLRNYILILLTIAVLASFSAAMFLSEQHANLAFYILPTRVWELLIGSIVAWLLERKHFFRTRDSKFGFLGVIGLFSILGIASTTNSNPLPLVQMLLISLFTGMLILFAQSSNILGRALSLKIFVKLGLVSYPAYLLHHPFFVFARHASSDEIGLLQYIVLISITFYVAMLVWKYIETPIRRQKIAWKLSFTGFAVTSVLLSILAVTTIHAHGFPKRVPENMQYSSLSEKLLFEGKVCEPLRLQTYSNLEGCDFGDLNSSKRLVIYGDSHAESLMSVLDRSLKDRNIRGTRLSFDSCGIIPNIVDNSFDLSNYQHCGQVMSQLTKYLNNAKADLIVAGRWSFMLYPVEGEINQMPYRNSEGGVEIEDYREYATLVDGSLDSSKNAKVQAFSDFVNRLVSTDSNLFFVYPIPEIGWDIWKLNWLNQSVHGKLLEEISIPKSDYLARNRFVISILESFKERSNFRAIKPFDIFCNTFEKDRCVAQFNTIPYYFDDDHLSDIGAKLIVQEILDFRK